MSQMQRTTILLDTQALQLACAWFDELVELDRTEQAQAIARLTQTQNAQAIAQLQRMLAADASGVAFEKAAQQARDACLIQWVAEDRLTPIGTDQIGGWTLDSELGRGGMGVVYLAHKPMQNFKLQGALKLMHDTHASSVLLDRFSREQQALSRLTHPGIARLFDVGTSARGPYLVMEFVQGEALLSASNRLDLSGRLALFLQICEAVAFAHQRLIIHRDIKPSNVMVVHDGSIKLMDFGIAKLLDDSVGERTKFVPMTPMYSAPEQRLGEATDVRTDVYGLGLLLFEMLCASTALRFTDATGTTVNADFDKPSRRVAQMPNTDAIAARALVGELDTIVMAATNSDPSKRYPSVEALAEDIRRWQNNLPIRAKPSSSWQHLHKFVRRNRLAVLSATVFGIALMSISAFALWQANRAERARLQAVRSAQVSDDVRQHFVGMLTRAVEHTQALTPSQLLDLADDLNYAQRKQSALAPDSRRALLLTLFPVAGMRQDYPRMQRYAKELESLMHGASDEETKAFIAYRAMLTERGTPDLASPVADKPDQAVSSSMQATMHVAKAVAAIRAGHLANAQIYAEQAQVFAANESDPLFQLAVRTALTQVQSKIGRPFDAIENAHSVLAGYQQQGVLPNTPFVRKTQEALLESYLLIGDIDLAQRVMDALKTSLDTTVAEDQLLIGIYHIKLSLLQQQGTPLDLKDSLDVVCKKDATALCASAHFWLALNALALAQHESAWAHLKLAEVAHPSEVALVQALFATGHPANVAGTLNKFVGSEPYGALRLLWILQALSQKNGQTELAKTLQQQVHRRARALDLGADAVYKLALAL
jgi:serine/threonine protein kinase